MSIAKNCTFIKRFIGFLLGGSWIRAACRSFGDRLEPLRPLIVIVLVLLVSENIVDEPEDEGN